MTSLVDIATLEKELLITGFQKKMHSYQNMEAIFWFVVEASLQV